MKTYKDLIASISHLGQIEYVGYTTLGYAIPLVHVGQGAANTLIIGSVHAREHITTSLLNRLVAQQKGISFDYLPMLNIDGVLLCKNGIDFLDDNTKSSVLKYNHYSYDFSQWKANINGVDLNVNFDADWGEGKSNITYPSSQNYIGPYAESEKETQAVVNLLQKNNYSMLACYHSKGEVIYWGFETNFRHYDKAKQIADNLGYSLERSEGSAGGIKDYYCTKYLGLGITIEVGKDSFDHPYPITELDNLVNQHHSSIELICKLGGEIAQTIYERGTN